MSNWEVVGKNLNPERNISSSDWEVISNASPNSQQSTQNESFGKSLAAAPFRVGEDIYRGLFDLIKNSPGYFEKAKKELPEAMNMWATNPLNTIKQEAAGLAELGQNVFNLPHDISNYATNRLHLIPENINEKIQMARMPSDTEEMINQTFGRPEQPGEELIRGLGRNALNILGGGETLNALNPLNITNKGITNSVINELYNQSAKHTKMYNKLWKEADKAGLNKVPFDRDALNLAPEILEKFYPEKSVLGLKDFLENPTLEKAQKAQSDLGILRRALEEKARASPLLETEKGLHKVLYDTEKHIEGNMFKDSSGNVNKKLAKQYRDITNSYRENVVPYKYNSNIQAYLNKELTKKELVQALNKGEFAAKKGSAHPAFGIRNALLPIFGGIGVLGGGKYLYDQMFGTPIENK